MARQRVSGGKRIDSHEIRSADGRTLKIDVYMVRKDYGTKFLAICDEIDLEEEGDDIDVVTKAAKKTAAERCDATWESYLHVTVKGVRHLPPPEPPKKKRGRRDEDEGEGNDDDAEEPDEAALPELFGKRESRGYGGRVQTTFKLEIEVDRYELATIAGNKVHRVPAEKGERAPQVHKDWPRVGRSEVHRYWNEPEKIGDMNALVRDTPEMRDALVRIRSTLADLTGRLDDLLSPDKVEATLARVLTGGGPLALPPPSSEPVTGEVVEPTLEEKLAEPVPKGRVRVKKAWIGTRPPSEGGNGPRG
jgi:hypothetical protein